MQMNENPYEPPKRADRPKSRWRLLWKRVCLVSLGVVGVVHAMSRAFATYGQHSRDTSWFKIVDGLFALGELISWVLVGVGGIGWIFSRRRPGNANAP
jgi:hypothetical protein